MTKTIQFKVIGRVQGVGFRYSTRDRAKSLEITGWVRNRLDGDVEGLAQGSDTNVNTFERWLWIGPSYAKVDRVECIETNEQAFSDFQIKR